MLVIVRMVVVVRSHVNSWGMLNVLLRRDTLLSMMMVIVTVLFDAMLVHLLLIALRPMHRRRLLGTDSVAELRSQLVDRLLLLEDDLRVAQVDRAIRRMVAVSMMVMVVMVVVMVMRCGHRHRRERCGRSNGLFMVVVLDQSARPTLVLDQRARAAFRSFHFMVMLFMKMLFVVVIVIVLLVLEDELVKWPPGPRPRCMLLRLLVLKVSHKVADVQCMSDLLSDGLLAIRFERTVAANSVVQRGVNHHFPVAVLKFALVLASSGIN